MRDIVGREPELRDGDAFIRALADGPGVLALEGEAGIGKTTVWAEIADRAEAAGLNVLRSQPAAAETSLTLSGLGDLLERIPEAGLEQLPPAQRRAIDAALLRTEPTGDALEQRLLGAAVRSVLVELSVAAPTLIAIDDVQWLDSASATTLGYALRRIGTARVGLLIARRRGLPAQLDLRAMLAAFDLRERRIGPLTLGALHHVLKDRLGRAPARSILVRIHQASRGNPLFAIEIVRLLEEIGEPPPDHPLPVPHEVQELVRQRMRRLPDTTREVLLVIAAQGDSTRASVAAALGRDVEPDLAIAAREEIVRVDDASIRFDHPLFAGAIYAEASDAQRRAAHRQLVGTVDGTEERARHRALATTGPDADLAAELERAAHGAAARGAPLAAAELLRLALQSTLPDDADARDDRTIELGQFLKRAGDVPQAERVLDVAVLTASTKRARARARLALANVLYDLDAGPRCGQLAAEALADVEQDDQLRVYAHAMLAAVEYSDRRLAAWHAHEAKRLLEGVVGPDPDIESFVLYVYVGAQVHAGRPLPMDLVERALAIERVAPAPSIADRLSATLGYWLMLGDDISGARHWMEATIKAVFDEGDEGSIPYALSHLPMLELAAGNWGRAEEVAERHLAAATEQGQASHRLAALSSLSWVYVLQGREEEARALVGDLLAAADASGSVWDLTKGLAVLGALELSLGDPESAARHLLRADDGRNTLGDEGPRRHEADLVESLVSVGQLDRATVVVAAMEERAGRSQRHSRLALAARSRALVSAARGLLDDAIAALDEAVREHDLAPEPFDRARTELVLGQVRRRRRERALAKVAFDAALVAFEQLGAASWARRARAELDRVGLRRGTGDTLSEGERRVAELVASGKTNREVAALLFLSPKTVEANLARAYRKLGVGSRAELGAVMSGATRTGAAD